MHVQWAYIVLHAPFLFVSGFGLRVRIRGPFVVCCVWDGSVFVVLCTQTCEGLDIPARRLHFHACIELEWQLLSGSQALQDCL